MLLSSSILKKENQGVKSISILGIFLTNSKCILNFCPKYNDFPTEHYKNNILLLAKFLLEIFFLLLAFLALRLHYFSFQYSSFFYIKCIFGDLLWFPWIRTEEQDD